MPKISQSAKEVREIRKLLERRGEDMVITDASNKGLEKLVTEYYLGNTKVIAGRRQDVRKKLEERVVKRIGNRGKWITDKLFELIEGVHVAVKVDKDNKVIKYYKTPPSLNAIIYALDRVLGKPKNVNIQGNFSLAKLLVDINNGNNRQDNNEKVSEKSHLLYRENVGLESSAG